MAEKSVKITVQVECQRFGKTSGADIKWNAGTSATYANGPVTPNANGEYVITVNLHDTQTVYIKAIPKTAVFSETTVTRPYASLSTSNNIVTMILAHGSTGKCITQDELKLYYKYAPTPKSGTQLVTSNTINGLFDGITNGQALTSSNFDGVNIPFNFTAVGIPGSIGGNNQFYVTINGISYDIKTVTSATSTYASSKALFIERNGYCYSSLNKYGYYTSETNVINVGVDGYFTSQAKSYYDLIDRNGNVIVSKATSKSFSNYPVDQLNGGCILVYPKTATSKPSYSNYLVDGYSKLMNVTSGGNTSTAAAAEIGEWDL